MEDHPKRWPRLRVRIRLGRRGDLTLPLLSVCALGLAVSGIALLYTGSHEDSTSAGQPVEPAPATVAEIAEPAKPLSAPESATPSRPPVESPKPSKIVKAPAEPAPPPGQEPIARGANPAVPSALPVLERCLEIERLAEDGSGDAAQSAAQVLIAEHLKHNNLVRALVEQGAEPLRAHLLALRMVQVAGEEERALATARILKREFLDLPEVVGAIREWKVLRPRISSVEVAIEGGRKLVVTGTLHNPDVTAIRRVRVLAEAIDAEGRVIGVAETRARPKLLGPESEGTFKVRIRGVDDPAAVARTRATIVSYDFEITEEI